MITDDPSYLLRIDKAQRQDALARRAADERARSSRPTPTRRRRCCATRQRTEIVITGGDVVTGHDLATGKELWRADGLNPTNNGSYRDRRLAARARRAAVRAVARAAAAGAQAGGRGDVTKSHVLWSFNQRARRADAGDRRHLSLFDQRPRNHVLPRREDRQDRLRSAAPAHRDLQRVAGAGGREDLHHRRRRRDDAWSRRARSSSCWPRTISPDYTLSSPAVSEGQIFIRTDAASLRDWGAEVEARRQ